MSKTPVQSIRLKCLDCSGGQKNEVRFCPISDCPLYAFRMGLNPRCKGLRVSEVQMKENHDGCAS